MVGEVELDDADADPDLPPWAGPEVTDDERYLNVNLVEAPFESW